MSGDASIVDLEANAFDEAAREALRDPTLRGALDRATTLFAEKRGAAVAAVPEWEELRERARSIKDRVLGALEENLTRFTERAEANGVVVHRARDRDEACRILHAIADAARARTIVKSKSMTTEEIGLNEVLEERGLRPVETDLGEWIVQLAGEKPSHIIAPAIHKTRGQIAELFHEARAADCGDDPEELAAFARQALRREFAAADVGVSGVNFAIVETGSFVVVENEGNARLTTSLPRVHVAVMGIEKLLPRLADLEVFLRLLPRSATGQRMTSYVSLFTGPNRGGEGPEELHLVVLDNGRRSMLGHPLTRQSLACIRCGACLNSCPVYKQVGGHAYGSVYPGPIGAVITPQLAGVEKARKLPFASSLCGACRDVCPVKIDIPALLLHLRSRIVAGRERPEARRGRLGERIAFRLWAVAMGTPRRYGVSTALGRVLQRRAARGGLARRLSGPLAAWASERELRPAARRTFRQMWKAGELEDER